MCCVRGCGWCVLSNSCLSLSLIDERGGIAGPSTSAVKDVTARVRREADVYVPHVGDLVQSTEEDAEDHQERLEALFEWVGMACLDAQRQVPSHHEAHLSRKCLSADGDDTDYMPTIASSRTSPCTKRPRQPRSTTSRIYVGKA